MHDLGFTDVQRQYVREPPTNARCQVRSQNPASGYASVSAFVSPNLFV